MKKAAEAFEGKNITFLECNCGIYSTLCTASGVHGIPQIHYVNYSLNPFRSQYSVLNGPFNAESLITKISNVTGIKPVMNFKPILYTNQTMLNRYKNCLSCFVKGNINGRYGSRLREVLGMFYRPLVVLSLEKDLVTTSYDEDTTNSYIHYFDTFFWLNFSQSNEMLTTVINYFCYKRNEKYEVKYIKALLNGSINAEINVFKSQKTTQDLVNFTKQMINLSDYQLKEHYNKISYTILHDDCKPEIVEKLRRRLHIITCIMNYRYEIIDNYPNPSANQTKPTLETDSDILLTKFAELRDEFDSIATQI